MWRNAYSHYSLAIKGIINLVVPIQVQHIRIQISMKIKFEIISINNLFNFNFKIVQF